MTGRLRGVLRGLLLGVVSIASAAAGLVLIVLGSITRQERAVAAGKRRYHGHAFERRWIGDDGERTRHAEIVADRLGLDESADGE